MKSSNSVCSRTSVGFVPEIQGGSGFSPGPLSFCGAPSDDLYFFFFLSSFFFFFPLFRRKNFDDLFFSFLFCLFLLFCTTPLSGMRNFWLIFFYFLAKRRPPWH